MYLIFTRIINILFYIGNLKKKRSRIILIKLISEGK